MFWLTFDFYGCILFNIRYSCFFELVQLFVQIGVFMKVSENKPHSIHLRLTDEQYQFCSDNAELMDVNVSEFLRMVVNSLVVTSHRLDSLKLGDLKYEYNKNNIEHKL